MGKNCWTAMQAAPAARRLPRGTTTLGLALLACTAGATVRPSLVPWPRNLTVKDGSVTLKAAARIVATDPSLTPLAEVLAEEIRLAFGARLPVETGPDGATADVVLRLSDAIDAGEGYRLTVDADGISVAGRTYRGVAWGTVTLLQSLTLTDGELNLPLMEILDEPLHYYRGVMIDVARRYNSIDALKRVVTMCRLHKIRYLHIHLTDDHGWTFPSTAFPKLGSTNRGFRGPAPKVYDLEELRDLVRFADARGVTLIPEMDIPGHTDQLRIPYPKVFDAFESEREDAHMGIVDMANPHAYEGLATLIGELCDVFRSSPYVHIGADEARIGRATVSPNYEAFTTEHGLDSPYELFCHFVREMDQIVRRNHKRTIIWSDGVRPPGSAKVTLPNDILVMAWENGSNRAREFVDHGFDVINATWNPLYVVNQTWDTMVDPGATGGQSGKYTPETIYNWNPLVFDRLTLDPTPKVVGAQLCAWEQGGEIQIPSLRTRSAALSERIWNPDETLSYEDFRGRLASVDALLSRLIAGFPAPPQGEPEQ